MDYGVITLGLITIIMVVLKLSFHKLEWVEVLCPLWLASGIVIILYVTGLLRINEKAKLETDFIDYIKAERNDFSTDMLTDTWWLEIPAQKRAKIENILIAYDQMAERLSKLQLTH